MTDEATRARVRMLLDAGQHQEALDLLAPLLSDEPGAPDLWCLDANALIGLQRFHDAMAAAKQASTLAPFSDEPHRIASIVLAKVRDVEGSARAAREAVRLAPTEPAAWERVCYSVGALLDQLGRSGHRADLPRIRELSEEVLVAADRVVALAPTSSTAYAARGYALACARRPAAANDAVERARQLDPDGASGLSALAGAPPVGLPNAGRQRKVAIVLAVMTCLVFLVAVAVLVGS